MESCIFSPWAGYYEDPEGTCYLFFYYVRTYVIVFRGGSRIFERGGGPGADTGFFTSTPPWRLSAWRHPPSENLKNTPTFGHSQAPPPPLGHCPRDVIHIPRGAGLSPLSHTHPGSATGVHLRSTSKKRGGSNFGSNVKKPTSWPKGGGGPDPLPPPPWIRHWYYVRT